MKLVTKEKQDLSTVEGLCSAMYSAAKSADSNWARELFEEKDRQEAIQEKTEYDRQYKERYETELKEFLQKGYIKSKEEFDKEFKEVYDNDYDNRGKKTAQLLTKGVLLYKLKYKGYIIVCEVDQFDNKGEVVLPFPVVAKQIDGKWYASLEFMVRNVDEAMQSLFLYMDPDPIQKKMRTLK